MDKFEMSGFDELISMFEGMDISEQKQRKALNVGGEIIKQSVENNAPSKSGKLKKSIKKTIKNENGEISCVIKSGKYYDIFTEYGTSFSKQDVGWFERAIQDAEDEAVKTIKEVILG